MPHATCHMPIASLCSYGKSFFFLRTVYNRYVYICRFLSLSLASLSLLLPHIFCFCFWPLICCRWQILLIFMAYFGVDELWPVYHGLLLLLLLFVLLLYYYHYALPAGYDFPLALSDVHNRRRVTKQNDFSVSRILYNAKAIRYAP